MVIPAIYRVHHIERLPLRTPYPAQVARVKYLKHRLPPDATLVIDDGGSRGVGDMFVDAGLDPIRINIVHGLDVHWHDRRVTVPKAVLVSMLVARLHSGELAVHEKLKDWPVLRRELLNFRPETTRTGAETWNARSGEHDDCVLSLAMAVWYLGSNGQPYSGLLRYYALAAGTAGGSQWVLSMDIGQAVDPSALTIVEKVEHASQADVRDEFRVETAIASRPEPAAAGEFDPAFAQSLGKRRAPAYERAMALPGKWFYRTDADNGVILQIELGAGYAVVINHKRENSGYVHVTCWDAGGEVALGAELGPDEFREWLDEAVLGQDDAIPPQERIKHRHPRL